MVITYLRLDPDQIIQTVQVLNDRIRERFPSSNLLTVADALLNVAKRAQVRSERIARPMYAVRLLSMVTILGLMGMFGLLIHGFRLDSLQAEKTSGIEEIIPMVEAGFQTLLMVGATMLFLASLEARVKRRRCLRAIHELRSIAHIIDMHQLTKDPERLLFPGPDTKSSPQRVMSAFELTRYLDYCIEMLSLAGKIAALYIQRFEDSEAVSAVNDFEDLTSGLSRKIWQKIMVLPSGVQVTSSSLVPHADSVAVPGPSPTPSEESKT